MEKNKEKIRTTIYIEKDLHKKAKVYCAKNETDLTKLLNEYLKNITKGTRI